ncbi:hypothetical protein ONZ45_g5677 [Pleurotus djamor]|nr:hypothetical protein ONZ45_g5677 [Pleurotus djamor]
MYGKEEFIHPTYQYPISSSPPPRPFWRTPKGILIICFVALLVVGGAVGGAVGGTLSKKTSSSDGADQQPALGSNEQGSATSLTYPGQRPDPTSSSSCVPVPTTSSPSTSSGGGVGARGYLRRQDGQGAGINGCSGLEEPPAVPN